MFAYLGLQVATAQVPTKTQNFYTAQAYKYYLPRIVYIDIQSQSLVLISKTLFMFVQHKFDFGLFFSGVPLAMASRAANVFPCSRLVNWGMFEPCFFLGLTTLLSLL